jgi:hypothetical protein
MAELLGVELARPGTWQLSNGPREFTPQMLRDAADFHASTGGQRIPLGFGHRDDRFDGDPAWGWLTNVHYAEDARGPVLVGDLVDLEDWVHAAAPSRWPHRSIEGVMGVKFQDREYGLVLTRLALLGATPPGMPALKSLSDLRQLVAAAAASSGGEWIAASIPETTPQGAQVPIDRKGAVGMPDAAKLREALGLAADASDDEVKTVLASSGLVASQPEPPQPAPDPTPDPAPQPAPDPQPQLVNASALPAGMKLVSESVWDETQKTIAKLSSFVDETKRGERDTILASAVEQGKFYPSQKDQFARLWDADPAGTRAIIDGLTPNSALAIAASGYADLEDKEFEREYAGLFPPSSNGGRRG